jgi:hypothetical protein
MRKQKCQAPWGCKNATAKSSGQDRRRVSNVELCRPCYQRVWDFAKKAGASKEAMLCQLEPKIEQLPSTPTQCARNGCGVHLDGEADLTIRRRIGKVIVCRNCYEAVWEYGRHRELTVQEAWKIIPPKGWHRQATTTVICAMPWCTHSIPRITRHRLDNMHNVCGTCRTYLKNTSRRYRKQRLDWKMWARKALKGECRAPDEVEWCIMTWCHRQSDSSRRGPKGEALCNADATYLYNYARRMRVTFTQAFRTAPPPRLLHTRS